MNIHESVLNNNNNKFNLPSIMLPPKKRAPKSVACSSRASELLWGKSVASNCGLLDSAKKSSSTKSASVDSDEDNIIMAITEGRGEARCEIGMAVVNVTRPILRLCQTSDTQSYANTLAMINIYNPNIVLYPATFEAKGSGNRLISEIAKYFPRKKLIAVPRKGFNKGNGLETLYRICIAESFGLLIMINNRYYALAACSGLLTYLENNLYIHYAKNCVKLEYQASDGFAMIDFATADRLELVSCNKPAQANKYSTLFGVMNRCLTRIGSRNLRSIILQPLFSAEKINERLDCVEELINKPQELAAIQLILPKLKNVDQLLSLSTLIPQDPQNCNNRQLNYVLLLNGILDTIDPLKEAINDGQCPFYIHLNEILNNKDFDFLKKFIRQTINESAHSGKGPQAEQQRIWAIQPGINGLLDLLRKTYSDRIEEMREYIKQLGNKYDLPLILANNNKKGFHITLTLNKNQKLHMKKSDLPKEFIQVFRLANSFTMKTIELVNLSTRIDNILNDLFTISNIMMHRIISKIKNYAYLFYILVEGIAYLDILQSLAEASSSTKWTRPKFNEFTAIEAGFHPLLSFLLQKIPTSNPVNACEHSNLHIITGPNGSGKSIYIRQVMLLQIMAQTGCFVPAASATFRLADKMYARISHNDDFENNASTFVLEMIEIHYILTTMTDRSLIIIDELCRSTSLEEGIAAAMSICDILARSKSFTFINTHFTLLTRMADLYFNIKVWQLKTLTIGDPNNSKTMNLDFKFNLIPGTTNLKGYGVYMVRGIWPEEVLNYVEEFQNNLYKKDSSSSSSSSSSSTKFTPKIACVDKRVQLRYELDCKLDKLKREKKFTLSNLNRYINDYQKEFLQLDNNNANSDELILEKDLIQKVQEENCVVEENVSSGLDHSIFDASSVVDDETTNNNNINNSINNNKQESRRDLLNLNDSSNNNKSSTKNPKLFTPSDLEDENSSCAVSLNLTRMAMDEEMENSFDGAFSKPLQDDIEKTSTPVEVVEAENPNNNNNLNANTYFIASSNLTFTLPESFAKNADVASIAEDLESLMGDVIDESDENNVELMKNDEKDKEHSERPLVHIFPIVKVVESANNFSPVEVVRYFSSENNSMQENCSINRMEIDTQSSSMSNFSYSPLIVETSGRIEDATAEEEEINKNSSKVDQDEQIEARNEETNSNSSKNDDVDEQMDVINEEANVETFKNFSKDNNNQEEIEETSKNSSKYIDDNDSNFFKAISEINDNSSFISETSRKRNFNSVTDHATRNNSRATIKKSTRKFIPPFKKNIKKIRTQIINNNNSSSISTSGKKFTDISKWTQKAIRQEFYEQDRKFYESTSGSSGVNYEKLLEDRLKRPVRPTPRQIQQTTCLATIRKTEQGVKVIPNNEDKRIIRRQKSLPLTINSTSFTSMNMNIFSDKNAVTFDQFIKSDHKDYQAFQFDFHYTKINKENIVLEKEKNVFTLKQAVNSSSRYTGNDQSWTFIRTRSEEIRNNSSPVNLSNFTLTPDGFYKRNNSNENITRIVKKYH